MNDICHIDQNAREEAQDDEFDGFGYADTDGQGDDDSTGRFAEMSGFDQNYFHGGSGYMTTREIAEILDVSVQTVTNAAKRLIDPSKVHWRVVNGGRSRIFTNWQTTEILEEIEKHHNLKKRWRKYKSNEDETDFGALHDSSGRKLCRKAGDVFLIVTSREMQKVKRRTKNVLSGEDEKHRATDAESFTEQKKRLPRDQHGGSLYVETI